MKPNLIYKTNHGISGKWLLLFGSIFFGSIGQILMKSGINHISQDDINYHLIPFYTHILKSFLLEMKNAQSQSDYHIRLSRSMLADPQTIGCMPSILFNKCSRILEVLLEISSCFFNSSINSSLISDPLYKIKDFQLILLYQ